MASSCRRAEENWDEISWKRLESKQYERKAKRLRLNLESLGKPLQVLNKKSQTPMLVYFLSWKFWDVSSSWKSSLERTQTWTVSQWHQVLRGAHSACEASTFLKSVWWIIIVVVGAGVWAWYWDNNCWKRFFCERNTEFWPQGKNYVKE